MRKSLSTILVGLLIISSSILAVPIELAHQGRLLDSQSQPVNGSYDITYRLFETSSSTQVLWQETQLVNVADGLFSVILGTSVPLDFSVIGYNPDSLWLEIQIGADPPISPRTKFTSTPFSSVAHGLRGDVLTAPGMLRILDPDSDGDQIPNELSMSSGTSGSSITLSKADAGKALNLYRTDPAVGLSIIDSSLVDSAMIDLRIDNTGGAGMVARSAKRVAKFKAGADLAKKVNKDNADDVGAYVGVSADLDRYLEMSVDSVSSSIVMADIFGDTTFSLKSQDDGVINTSTWTQTSGPYVFSSSTGPISSNSGLSKADSKRALEGFINDSSTGLYITDELGDTTYILEEKADVKVEKFNFKQQFGQTQGTRQGVGGNTNGGFFEATSYSQTDSSVAIVSAIEPRSTLKTYFETGNVPTSSSVGSSGDSSYIELMYDSSSYLNLSVGANGSSVGGSKTVDTPDEQAKYDFSVHPDRMELTKSQLTGGAIVASGWLGWNTIGFTDSLGDTSLIIIDNGDQVSRVYNKRKFASEELVDRDQALKRTSSREPSDTTIQKVIEEGVAANGAYLVMLDSLADTTVIMEGSRGAFNGGRFVIRSGVPLAGIGPGDVELSDLDADGLTDIRCDGNVGIGVQVPTSILEVAQGSITDPIADAWTTYSSRRWKTNIETISGAMAKILMLRGVEYDWKKDGKHDIGLIAEEVGEVIPEVVTYEKNGVDAKSVDYPRLVALLIEASKEQQSQMDRMQSEIDELTAMVKQLAGSSVDNKYTKK